jgi:MarR family transcriptional regulator, lower aerobic nicotinate degradation pathway regulator
VAGGASPPRSAHESRRRLGSSTTTPGKHRRRDLELHPHVAETLDAIRRIVRVLRLSSRASERQFGIGSAQLFVLQQLAESPANSINDLAERTYTHQSSVSIVVRRLVEQGLVMRRPATNDRRRRELKLTAAGRRLAVRAPVPGQVRLIGALRSLPLAELRTLGHLLERIVSAMGASREPPGMLFAEEVPEGGHSEARESATSRSALGRRRRNSH